MQHAQQHGPPVATPAAAAGNGPPPSLRVFGGAGPPGPSSPRVASPPGPPRAPVALAPSPGPSPRSPAPLPAGPPRSPSPVSMPPRAVPALQAQRLAAALTPAARARGVQTAAELQAAGAAAQRAPVPQVETPPRSVGPWDVDAIAEAGPVEPGPHLTRAECERAAREGRWVGLATPQAWAAALERDEQRHACALELLRRQLWGLYERQRGGERETARLWAELCRLGEALRCAVRGDPAQAALFGVIVEGKEPPDVRA